MSTINVSAGRNPLVVSKVGKNGQPYDAMYLADGDKDYYAVFIGYKEAVEILGAFRHYGPDVAAWHIRDFVATGKVSIHDTTLMSSSEWEGKQILRLSATVDGFGFRKGQGGFKKMLNVIDKHGAGTFVDALVAIVGDRTIDNRPERRPFKGKGKSAETPKASPATTPKPEPVATVKPEPTPAVQKSPTPAVKGDRLAEIEQTLAGMALVMERLRAEIASIRAESDKPEPPKPAGPSGGDTPKVKPETPRKGGKGRHNVVHTASIKGRAYGLTDTGETVVECIRSGRSYWRIQTGRNQIHIKPDVTSTTPRNLDHPAKGSRGRKVSHKAMFPKQYRRTVGRFGGKNRPSDAQMAIFAGR